MSTYKEEVKVNIANNKYANMEIDAITLETLIENNKVIGEINNEIVSKFGNVEFTEEINPVQCEESINGLRFLGIYTLEQLLQLIQDRKEDAIKFVRTVSEILKEENKLVLSRSVAFMYLCYVELLHQTEDSDEIEKYLRETKIMNKDVSCKSMADILLKINRQVQK